MRQDDQIEYKIRGLRLVAGFGRNLTAVGVKRFLMEAEIAASSMCYINSVLRLSDVTNGGWMDWLELN